MFTIKFNTHYENSNQVRSSVYSTPNYEKYSFNDDSKIEFFFHDGKEQRGFILDAEQDKQDGVALTECFVENSQGKTIDKAVTFAMGNSRRKKDAKQISELFLYDEDRGYGEISSPLEKDSFNIRFKNGSESKISFKIEENYGVSST